MSPSCYLFESWEASFILGESGIIGYVIAYESWMIEPQINVSQELLKLITELDEFKGKWELLKTMSPKRLAQLRKVATIESIGSSTRIEGAKLSDAEVEILLSNLQTISFKTRDEEEVAGYAEAIDMVF